MFYFYSVKNINKVLLRLFESNVSKCCTFGGKTPQNDIFLKKSSHFKECQNDGAPNSSIAY